MIQEALKQQQQLENEIQQQEQEQEQDHNDIWREADLHQEP